ncbi:hypothetical protein lbkm_4237 [Lachnospiraceae bacterium KM106-2]|nr:hypothetical protein lbkm_4237 [Lachnospiraceae bacterium KM106-2]
MKVKVRENRIYDGPSITWPLFLAMFFLQFIYEAIGGYFLHAVAVLAETWWLFFFLLHMINDCSTKDFHEVQSLWIKRLQTIGVYAGVVGLSLISCINIWNHPEEDNPNCFWLVLLVGLCLELSELFMSDYLHTNHRKMIFKVVEAVIFVVVFVTSSVGSYYYIHSCF